MKVLMFSLNGKGMLHYSTCLANALCEGHNVSLIISKKLLMENPKAHDKRILCIPINSPFTPLKALFSSLNIFKHLYFLKMIKKINPDIVLITDNHPWYLLYGWIFRKKLRVVQHDPLLHMGENSGLFANIAALTNKMLRKWAQIVFVHGIFLKKQIKDVPQEKIKTIFHGTYDFFTHFKEEYNERRDVLFFGRFSPYKGLDVLVKAARQLPEVTFTIAGEGEFDFVIPKNVLLINEYLSEKNTAKQFRSHKIIVLPYKDASQTGIIPIAYSFKKAVVASDVGSLKEVVVNGKTGLLVTPNNSKELSKAITKLLNSDHEQMGESAYKFMKQNMNWKNISEEITK